MVTLGACGKKAEQGGGEAGSAATIKDKAKTVETKAGAIVDKVKDKVADKVGAVTAKGEPLTAEEYEKLIVALGSCKLSGYSIDHKCDAAVALKDRIAASRSRMQDLFGRNAEIGRKLITHEAPAVRVKAVELMGSLTGTTADSQDAVIAAAAVEKDPQVLQAFIRTVANAAGKNPKVGDMLITAADHADKDVRLQAIYALSSSWNKEFTKGAEKLASMVEKDTDPKVRQTACKYGGQLGNKVMMPVLTKYTEKPDADPELYGRCMEGIAAMFHQYPFYETDNADAYKLFLKRLAMTPRGKNNPPWLALGLFKYTNKPGEKLDAWKKRATWFKPAEVRKVLAAIVEDEKAEYLARTSSCDSLLGLEASKAELEAIKKKIEAAKGHAQVIRKLNEVIAQAK